MTARWPVVILALAGLSCESGYSRAVRADRLMFRGLGYSDRGATRDAAGLIRMNILRRWED